MTGRRRDGNLAESGDPASPVAHASHIAGSMNRDRHPMRSRAMGTTVGHQFRKSGVPTHVC
jgi:hypothetical protein